MPDEITDTMRLDEAKEMSIMRVNDCWRVRYLGSHADFEAPTLRRAIDMTIEHKRRHAKRSVSIDGAIRNALAFIEAQHGHRDGAIYQDLYNAQTKLIENGVLISGEVNS